MAHGELTWLEIPAEDPVASAAFYGAVFGWTIAYHDDFPGYPMYADAEGRLRGGFTDGWPPRRGRGYMPYITVDDLNDVLALVSENGGEVLKPKTLVSEDIGWQGRFRDPAGNEMGLFEAV